MKAKTKQLRFLWVVVLLLPLAFFYNCKKGPDSPSQKKDSDSLRIFNCYKKKTEGKVRVIGYLENVRAYVFKEKIEKDCKAAPQCHFVILINRYLPVIEEPKDSIIRFLTPPQKIYRCGGDPYNEDAADVVLISGFFYAVEIKGREVFFYDEGEGKPSFTKIK